MPSNVIEVEYYYSLVADKPGEARKLLEFLSERQVNLMAFTIFPVGEGRSQIDFFPTDPDMLQKAADDAKIGLITRILCSRLPRRAQPGVAQGSDQSLLWARRRSPGNGREMASGEFPFTPTCQKRDRPHKD